MNSRDSCNLGTTILPSPVEGGQISKYLCERPTCKHPSFTLPPCFLCQSFLEREVAVDLGKANVERPWPQHHFLTRHFGELRQIVSDRRRQSECRLQRMKAPLCILNRLRYFVNRSGEIDVFKLIESSHGRDMTKSMHN